ncbi:MAG TPA: hypothetical protein DCS93_30120 [Microscillaceae bacterium]|nr:hypothetical protein [Microscillaceae bacterium]
MRKRALKAQKEQEAQHQRELAQKKVFEYVQEAGKPCSVAQFRAIDNGVSIAPMTSRFLGDQVVLLPQESLPENQGKVMTPILQVNLTEVPYLPEALQGKAWLSIFMDLESMLLGTHPNGENWVLRAYDSLEGLEIREIPLAQVQEQAKKWQAAQISWTQEMDVLDICSAEYHVLPEKWRNYQEDIPLNYYRFRPRQWFDESTQEIVQFSQRFEGDHQGNWHVAATKLGGFPTYHQSDEYQEVPSYPGSFVLQVMNGIKHKILNHLQGKKCFDLCDCSTTYIGWIDGKWWMETQTS